MSGVLTFLFADVRGYTRFTAEHGDEAAARLAARFAAIAREVMAVERLRMVPGAHNAAYLRTKRDRMGHDLILDEHDKGASA